MKEVIKIEDERIIRKKLGLVEASLSSFNSLLEQNIFNLILFVAQETLHKSMSNDITLSFTQIASYLKTGSRNFSKSEIQIALDGMISTNMKIKEVAVYKNRETSKVRDLRRRANLREFTTYDPTTRQDFESITERYNFFTSITSNTNQDEIIFSINPKIKDKYIFISKGDWYIKTLSSITKRSSSIYTPKIIEVLSRNLQHNKGKTNKNLTMSLETLKDLLGVADKYEKKAGFQKIVLDTAKKEALEKFDFEFDYEIVKIAVGVYDVVLSMTDEAKQRFHKKLSSIEYITANSIALQEADKLYLDKSKDTVLAVSRLRTQDETLKSVKMKLKNKQSTGYLEHFEKSYEDIQASIKWNEYDLIKKDGSVKTISFGVLEIFINCMIERVDFEEQEKAYYEKEQRKLDNLVQYHSQVA